MLKAEIRPGAYYDSVILMQLQRALAALPAVQEAGVVMIQPSNQFEAAKIEASRLQTT